jgi:O-antigen/teichoic acid export membrane protein
MVISKRWIPWSLTMSNRVIGNLVNLFLLGYFAKNYGIEMIGFISLFLLQVSVSYLFSGIFSGSSAIFFAQKWNRKNLLVIGIIGTTVFSVIGSTLLQFIGLIPEEIGWYFIPLALIQSITSFFQSIQLGKGRLNPFNASQVLATIGLPLFFFLLPIEDVYLRYPTAWACGYLLALIPIIWFPANDEGESIKLLSGLKTSIRYGFWAQLTNLGQMLNYRLAYYFLEFEYGREMVGIYSACIQLAEATWLPAKSLGTVHLSALLQKDRQKNDTQLAMKMALYLSLFGVIILIFLPETYMVQIFGSRFMTAQPFFMGLAPGIVAFAPAIIVAQYFSAHNKIIYNSIATAVGLVITLTLGAYLSIYFSVVGAVCGTTISHLFNSITLLYFFNKTEKISWRKLLNPFTWNHSK